MATGQERPTAPRSFEEAMLPLLELIERLSPDGQVEVIDIQAEKGSERAVVTVRIPIAWTVEQKSATPEG